MNARYPLQPLLLAQGRRVERALADVAAANGLLRQRQVELLEAQRRLDAVRQARWQLQQDLSDRISGCGEASLSAADFTAPARRLGWLQDRVDECIKTRTAAATALDEAQTVATQARELYHRAQAKQDGLLTHQSHWQRQRAGQRLRSEEAGTEDLLAHRSLSSG